MADPLALFEAVAAAVPAGLEGGLDALFLGLVHCVALESILAFDLQVLAPTFPLPTPSLPSWISAVAISV